MGKSNKKESNNESWALKFSPSTVDDIIFPSDKIENIMRHYIEQGYFNNLSLYGPPGRGKSSLAKILINSVTDSKADVLRLNASINNRIDDIRNEVIPFVNTKPVESRYKVVLFEEADRLTVDAQKTLKDILESNSHTKFIFVSNNPDKYIEALNSRLESYAFTELSDESVLYKLVEVMDYFEIDYTDDDLDILGDIYNKHGSDLRGCIKTLQQCCITGKLESLLDTDDNTTSNLLEEWKKNWDNFTTDEDAFTNMIELSHRVDMLDFGECCRYMYNNTSHIPDQFLKYFIPEISEALYRSTFCSDYSILLTAMLYRIKMLLEQD